MPGAGHVVEILNRSWGQKVFIEGLGVAALLEDHWEAKDNLNRDLWFDLQWSYSLMGHIMASLSSMVLARDRKVAFAQSPYPRISQAQGFQNLSLFPHCIPSNLRQANLTVPADWLPPVLFSVI